MSASKTEPELPPPASGLFLEVSFRRLLASCEGVVNGTAAGSNGDAAAASTSTSTTMIRPDLSRNWATSPVFHHYVETLQEQLADLEGAAPAKRPSAEVLAAYKRRADALSARLRPPAAPPSYVLALAGQGKGKGGGAAAAAAAASEGGRNEPGKDASGAGGDGSEAQHEARRAELLGPDNAASTSSPSSFGPAVPPAMRPAAPPASLKGLAPRTAEEVSTQRGLQETLTDDLVGLARRLRANAEAAGAAVAERERLLRAAEGALDGAVEGAKRSVAEVKAVYFANRRGFWATLMTFLMVGAVFTATFVYIRATSLLGFSSKKAVAATARRAAARAEKAAAAAAKNTGGGGGGGRGEGGGVETVATKVAEEAATATIPEAAAPAEGAPELGVATEPSEAAAAVDHTEL